MVNQSLIGKLEIEREALIRLKKDAAYSVDVCIEVVRQHQASETPSSTLNHIREWLASFERDNEEDAGISFFDAQEKFGHLQAILNAAYPTDKAASPTNSTLNGLTYDQLVKVAEAICDECITQDMEKPDFISMAVAAVKAVPPVTSSEIRLCDKHQEPHEKYGPCLVCEIESLERKILVLHPATSGYSQMLDNNPLEHARNCAGNIPLNDHKCTCGLKWRIMLQTEQTMHNAWRKRAEEAEALLNKRELVNLPKEDKYIISEMCMAYCDGASGKANQNYAFSHHEENGMRNVLALILNKGWKQP